MPSSLRSPGVITALLVALAGCEAGDEAAPTPADTQAGDTAMADGSDAFAASDTVSAPEETGAPPEPPEEPEACPPVEVDMIAGDPLVIPTREGPVVGVLNEGVRSWLGIPYAAPPIGERRFRTPEAPTCRTRPLVASAFRPACPQLDEAGGVRGDEDCLTLNIWSPAPSDEARAVPGPGLPVVVFIHGGGNVQGSANVPLPSGASIYDGRFMASLGGAVVVTMQYRLGALGWLAHPALMGEAEGSPVGNFGLEDQQRALRWIQRHIAAFGGDPERVVLVGESAGAVNTIMHLAAPSSDGLFARAIIQSGAAVARPLDDALEAGEAMVAESDCGDLADPAATRACLEALPVSEVLAQLPGQITIGDPTPGLRGSNFGPVIDGVLLPEPPLTLLARRYQGDVDAPAVMVGSNADEMAELLVTAVETEEAYEAFIRRSLAPIAAVLGPLSADEATTRILETYPLASYGSPRDALVDIYTDLRFTCTALDLLTHLHRPGRAIHRFFFQRRAEVRGGLLPASHGRELLYIFGSWRLIPLYVPAEADIRLSRQMMETWIAFASSDRPVVRLSQADTLPWPAWRPERDSTLLWDAKVKVVDGVRQDRCAVWSSLLTPSL